MMVLDGLSVVRVTQETDLEFMMDRIGAGGTAYRENRSMVMSALVAKPKALPLMLQAYRSSADYQAGVDLLVNLAQEIRVLRAKMLGVENDPGV